MNEKIKRAAVFKNLWAFLLFGLLAIIAQDQPVYKKLWLMILIFAAAVVTAYYSLISSMLKQLDEKGIQLDEGKLLPNYKKKTIIIMLILALAIAIYCIFICKYSFR